MIAAVIISFSRFQLTKKAIREGIVMIIAIIVPFTNGSPIRFETGGLSFFNNSKHQNC
jgi:hypothetical protein